MKKKICLVLCMLSLPFLLTGCAGTLDYQDGQWVIIYDETIEEMDLSELLNQPPEVIMTLLDSLSDSQLQDALDKLADEQCLQLIHAIGEENVAILLPRLTEAQQEKIKRLMGMQEDVGDSWTLEQLSAMSDEELLAIWSELPSEMQVVVIGHLSDATCNSLISGLSDEQCIALIETLGSDGAIALLQRMDEGQQQRLRDLLAPEEELMEDEPEWTNEQLCLMNAHELLCIWNSLSAEQHRLTVDHLSDAEFLLLWNGLHGDQQEALWNEMTSAQRSHWEAIQAAAHETNTETEDEEPTEAEEVPDEEEPQEQETEWTDEQLCSMSVSDLLSIWNKLSPGQHRMVFEHLSDAGCCALWNGLGEGRQASFWAEMTSSQRSRMEALLAKEEQAAPVEDDEKPKDEEEPASQEPAEDESAEGTDELPPEDWENDTGVALPNGEIGSPTTEVETATGDNGSAGGAASETDSHSGEPSPPASNEQAASNDPSNSAEASTTMGIPLDLPKGKSIAIEPEVQADTTE